MVNMYLLIFQNITPEPIKTCSYCNILTRVDIISSTVLLEKHLLMISNLGCTRELKKVKL